MEKEKEYTLPEIIEILARTFGEMESRFLMKGLFAELSMRQLHYVELIHELENPTLSELAYRLDVSKPTVTTTINRLVASGFIEKRASFICSVV